MAPVTRALAARSGDRDPAPARERARTVRDWAVPSAIAAIGGVLLAAYAQAVPAYSVTPDELRYVEQATAFAAGGPLGESHPAFTSWSQLVPALYALAFLVFDDVGTAVDAARVLGALAMASAAIPVHRIVLAATGARRPAGYAAVLALAVPWVATTAGILTEPVAYAVAAWAFLAFTRAIAAPGPRWDALALLAAAAGFASRTQLAVLLPIFLTALVVHELALGRERLVERLLRRHAVAWAATAAGAALLAAGVVSRTGLLASAAGIWDGGLPEVSLPAARTVLGYSATAVGVLPFVLGAGWAVDRLAGARRSAADSGSAAAAVTLAGLVGFFLVSGLLPVQVPSRVHDRYFAYAVPLAMAATCIALHAGPRRSWPYVGIAAGIVWVVAGLGFHERGASLLSPTFATHAPLAPLAGRTWSGLGIDAGTGALVAVYAGLAILGGLLAHARLARGRRVELLGIALVVFCGAVTARTLAVIRDERPTEPAGPHRAWVDAALPEGARAIAVPGPPAPAELGPLDPVFAYAVVSGRWFDLAFWNRAVDSTAVLHPRSVYRQETVRSLAVAADGTVRPWARHWIFSSSDARFRPASARVVARHGGLELVEAAGPPRAAFHLRGGDRHGLLRPGRPATLRVFGAPAGGAATLVLQRLAGGPGAVTVASGRVRRRVPVGDRPARVAVAIAAVRPTLVRLAPAGPGLRVQLVDVRLEGP